MRVCRVGVWFGFVRSALLLAVDTCVVLSFEALPGLSCFLRVTRERLRNFLVSLMSHMACVMFYAVAIMFVSSVAASGLYRFLRATTRTEFFPQPGQSAR